jgi:hypothetical protein
MKKTIYAASAGSYSDYRVIGLFSTKEKALRYMEMFPREEWNDIEEYGLDEHAFERSDRFPFRVRMTKDGDVLEAERDDYPGHLDDAGAVHWYEQLYGKPTKTWTNFYMQAKDAQHAIKIANERRIAALAEPQARPSDQL